MLLSRETVDQFGDLVAAIGTPDFGGHFYRLFSDLLRIEECTVFSFPVREQPTQVVIEGASPAVRATARKLAQDYVAGGYRDDPNFQRRPRRSTVYAMTIEEIRDDRYRGYYYDRTNLTHELVLSGQIGGTRYISSFYRRAAKAGFDGGDIGTLDAISPLILKSLHRHNQLAEAAAPGPRDEDAAWPEDRADSLDLVRRTLLSAPDGLSPREAEVCAGIMLGYSTLAIGLNCGISTNTVATHRKRAYSKLGICSQNELFLRYLAASDQTERRYS